MKCNFCGREVPKGTEECPYCHYRFEQEARRMPILPLQIRAGSNDT